MTETRAWHQLGEQLRVARQTHGWSVADAAERIGASPFLVRQLEHDGGAEVAPVYRDSFLQRYMKLMNLDGELVPSSTPPAVRPILAVAPVTGKNPRGRASVNWARYAALCALIVLPIGWFGIDYSVAWLTDGSETLPHVGHSGSESKAPRQQVRRIPARRLPRGPAPTSEVGVEAASSSQTEVERLAEDASEASAPLVYELTVRAKQDSWVEVVDSENSQLEHDLLRKNTAQRYQGQPPFDLLVGKGSAVELALNGQVVDHLAEVGDEPRSVGLIKLRVFADGRAEPTS